MIAALWAFFSSLIIGLFTLIGPLIGWLLWYAILFVIPFGITIYGSYKGYQIIKKRRSK